jgi:hypothetical protein
MKFASNYHLRAALSEFEKNFSQSKHPEYLQEWVEKVENLRKSYTERSHDAKLSPRIRARNRDLEQSALGILVGIKFSLLYMEAPTGLLKPEAKESKN